MGSRLILALGGFAKRLDSPHLIRICNDLLEASIPAWVKDATTALAADWTDVETWSRPPRHGTTDRHAIVGQQRDERVPQVPRRPVPAEPGPLANVLEHLPDVPGTQRNTGGRGEYPAGVLPTGSGSLSLSRVVHLPLPERPTAICASFSARRVPSACTGGSRLWLPGLRLAFQKGHLAAQTWWAQLGSNQ